MTKCHSCSSDKLQNLKDVIICSNCGTTIYKKKNNPKETLTVYLLKGIYFLPIMIFFLIIIAFSITTLINLFNYNFPIFLDQDPLNDAAVEKLLIYFFIFLAIIDLNGLVFKHYVHPFISGKNIGSSFSEKRYLEKLLVFGAIIILLDMFPKLFKDDNNNIYLAYILFAVSFVIISIGIWKFLSIKAEKYVQKSDNKES